MARRLRREHRRRLRLAAGAGLAGAIVSPGVAEAGVPIIVSSLDDDSGSSLRAAIDAANTNPDASTITFASTLSGDYDLGSSLPSITEPVEIIGPGAGVLAVDGVESFRILQVNLASGEDFKLSGLTLKEGNAQTGNGDG